jgi:L-asparaginase
MTFSETLKKLSVICRENKMSSLWSPFFDLARNGIVERSLFGAAVARHGNQTVFDSSNPVIYGRSLTKPFQMKAVAEILDPVLPWEEKAIALSSHDGNAEQLGAVQKILPANELALIQLPSLSHPCSGKHAAIIKACELMGWPTATYKSIGHPYNLRYRELLEKNLGRSLENETVAADGCGLPTWAMSVSELAGLFVQLVKQKNQDWIWEAAHRFPQLIGGKERVDSQFLQFSDQLFAKEGADGLLGIAVESPRYPQGLGLVVKIAHGYDPKVAWQVAYHLLQALGIEAPKPADFDGQEIIWSESFQNSIRRISR